MKGVKKHKKSCKQPSKLFQNLLLTDTIIMDLPDSPYSFPTHISLCSDRPDIVRLNTQLRPINIVELTIPLETTFDVDQTDIIIYMNQHLRWDMLRV